MHSSISDLWDVVSLTVMQTRGQSEVLDCCSSGDTLAELESGSLNTGGAGILQHLSDWMWSRGTQEQLRDLLKEL